MTLPIYRAEPVALSGQGAQQTFFSDLGPKPVIHTSHEACSLTLPGLGSKCETPSMPKYGLQPYPTRETNRNTWEDVWPIL